MEGRGGTVSKNKFDVRGDRVYITHDKWDFIATASLKDEYAEELMSVTWTKNGEYLYSSKLGTYLHIYIMKKWYGEEKYEQMKSDGYVVDHMDNDARAILYDYRRDYSFVPEMLHNVDYHIEGCYGTPWPIEVYNRYIAGGHGHGVVIIHKKAPISNWTLDDKRHFFYLRG